MEKDKRTRQRLCVDTVKQRSGMCLEVGQTRRHLGVNVTGTRKKTNLVQTTILSLMKNKEPFPDDSDSAKAFTDTI